MMNLEPFLNLGVSPYHAAEALKTALVEAGASLLEEGAPWSLHPGKLYVVQRSGTALAAFRMPRQKQKLTFSLALAHLDSPALKLKVKRIRKESGLAASLGTEVYGGPLLHTWFDRDLGLAGRIYTEKNGQAAAKNIRTPALAVIPSLAIHFNREANKGTAVDAQKHLNALVSLPQRDFPGEQLLDFLLELQGEPLLGADLFLYDGQPAQVYGSKDQPGLITSGRIDNLAGCQAVLEALTGAAPADKVQMGLFFDHEEVGSLTRTGADSPWLGELMERILFSWNPDAPRDILFQAQAGSFALSIDAAHGVHPNFADRHDEAYAPQLGEGPVLKSSARYSYATTAETEAAVRLWCQKESIPLQTFIMRSDLTPGSTVGPTSSSWTGVPCADLGIPILAMHSIRETAHLEDQKNMIRLIRTFYEKH